MAEVTITLAGDRAHSVRGSVATDAESTARASTVGAAGREAPEADERQGNKAQVGYWNYSRFQVGFEATPRKCVFVRNGGTSSAESVHVADMENWKH